MKQSVFIFLLLFICGNCTAQTQIVYNDIDSNTYAAAAAKYNSLHSKLIDTMPRAWVKCTKYGITLVVSGTKKVVKLKNNLNEEDADNYHTYKYEGYVRSLDCYLISEDLITDRNVFLIDAVSGKCSDMKLFVVPFNQKYIIVYDIPECDHYTGLEVLEKKADSFTKVVSEKKKDGFLDEIIWTGTRSFAAQRHFFTGADMGYVKGTIVKLP